MNKKIVEEIIFLILRLAIVAILVILAYKSTTTCYEFGYKIFADEAKDPAPGITKTVAIVDGKSVKEIGKILEEHGLIDDGFLFIFQAKFSEYDGQMKPGVYELSTAMTPYEMIETMATSDEEDLSTQDPDTESTPLKDAATLWDAADDVAGESTPATE